MSYPYFLGLICGMVFGILFAAVIYLRRNDSLEHDERTALAHAKAGQWSYYTAAVIAFLLWIADGVRVGQAGGQIQFFSPWGVAFWGLIPLYLAAFLYHQWASSGTLLACALEKRRRLGIMLAISSATLGHVSKRLPAFLYVQAAMSLTAIYLICSSSRKAPASR